MGGFPASPVPPRTWRQIAELLRTKQWSAAIETLRTLASDTGCCEVRITLGVLLAEREQFFEAISLLTGVIEDATQAGRRDYLAAAFHNLAAIYREVGDYDLARRFQQRAMHFQDDFGAEDLLQLAGDALAASRWELAEGLLQSAAEMLTDDDPLHATILAAAGTSRAMQGDLTDAVGLLRTAYRQHVELGDEAEAGRDLLNLAATLRRAGRLQLESKCLARAARHFQRADVPHRHVQCGERQRQTRQLAKLQSSNPGLN